jgi:hypothetical protein
VTEHDDESQGVDEGTSGAMNLIEPVFEVGPPGVGPVMGFDSGDFFQPVRSDEDDAEHPAAAQSESD